MLYYKATAGCGVGMFVGVSARKRAAPVALSHPGSRLCGVAAPICGLPISSLLRHPLHTHCTLVPLARGTCDVELTIRKLSYIGGCGADMYVSRIAILSFCLLLPVTLVLTHRRRTPAADRVRTGTKGTRTWNVAAGAAFTFFTASTVSGLRSSPDARDIKLGNYSN